MNRKTVLKISAAAAMSLSLLAGCMGGESGSRGNIGDREEEVTPTEAPATPTPAEATPTEAPTPTPEPEPETLDYRLLELSSYQTGRTYFDDDYQANLASVEVTHLELLDEDLPKLKAAIDAFTEDHEKYVYGSEYDSFVDSAKENAKAWGGPVELYEKYDTNVVRADTVVTSLLTYYEDFQGGAHGVYYNIPVNYDSVTGEELNINDVINPGRLNDLPEILEERLLEEYDAEYFFNPDSLASDIAETYEMTGDYYFSVGYEGITVYFQIYALAPYAAGAQSIFLRYLDYPGLVNEKYTSGSSNYFINLSAAGNTLPHSGEELEAWLSDQGQDLMYTNLHIRYNGVEYKEKVFAYRADYWVAGIGSENYLFVSMRHEDDYETINIYWLDSYNNKVEFKSEYLGGFYNNIPSDPLNFRLCKISDLLSTYTICQYYYIARTGEPVTTDEYYLVNVPRDDFYLTAKKDISVDIIEEQPGTAWESIEYHDFVKKGEKMYFYATDNESWVEFKLEDGRHARVTLDSVQWPQTVNGEDIEDLFDGIMFAG